MTIDRADDSKISNRTINTNLISNRTYDSKSNQITKLRRSLLYSAELWPLTIPKKKKLDAAHHKFQQRLLGITWKDKVRNENQTKLQRMDLIIKERRLRWLGHVLRMEDDRISKQATRWQTDSCTRRAGRPRSNWIDTVSRDLKSIGMAWEDAEQAAVDREDWHGRVAQCVFDTG